MPRSGDRPAAAGRRLRETPVSRPACGERDTCISRAREASDALAREPASMERAVPDRFVFVWSGPDFPYYARLAVESALIAEPDCEVEIHLLDLRPPRGVHFLQVASYDRVSIAHVNADELFAGLDAPAARYSALYDRIPPERRSARSNLVRYAVLHRRGGVYLDFDVIVHRDLAELRAGADFIGAERVWVVDQPRVSGRRELWMVPPTMAWATAYALRRAQARLGVAASPVEPLAPIHRSWSAIQANNAVIGARAGSPFLRRVLAAALEVDPSVRYALGPALVDQVARQSPDLVSVLPPAVFYCVPPSHSFRFFSGPSFDLPEESRLIHFVHSNHRRLLARIDAAEALRRRGRSTFFRLAAPVVEAARALPRRGADA
jgi:Glycosyltransferase sugar-binding region containing DXD motif